MTSMRIDGDKSAKLWAKRLGKLFEEIKADGCDIFSEHADWGDILIVKDNKEAEVFW